MKTMLQTVFGAKHARKTEEKQKKDRKREKERENRIEILAKHG